MNDLVTLVEGQRSIFDKVRVVTSIDFDREAGFAVQIITASDYLLKVAMQNKESLKNAVTNVAAIGISLNPASKLAYLVPRKQKISLDISYMGLMQIAQECGAIQWGQAVLVRKKDKFQLRSLGEQPIHEYDPFDEDRGDITGVYVVVKTAEGDYLTHPMKIKDVFAIRDRSEAWKAYVEKKTACPWVTDEGEMIKKTCVKQAAKYWPRRERLDQAVHHLNTEGDEGISIKANTMSDDECAQWKSKIEKATTKEAAKAVWREALAICEQLGDAKTAEKLKADLLKHGEFIDRASKVAA
jgi:recombination protein RecT